MHSFLILPSNKVSERYSCVRLGNILDALLQLSVRAAWCGNTHSSNADTMVISMIVGKTAIHMVLLIMVSSMAICTMLMLNITALKSVRAMNSLTNHQ